MRQFALTIASGQGHSGAVDLAGDVPVGVRLPDAFTGTALTFEAAESNPATNLAGAAFKVVKNAAGASVSITVAQGTFVTLDPALLAGVRWLKLVSGSNEGADRTVYLTTRPR